jgi:hypothetical protein
MEITGGGEHSRTDLEVLPPYARFLRRHDRDEEAVGLETRVAELCAASRDLPMSTTG